MISKKNISILSILMTTTSFAANCTGGACFASLDNIKPLQTYTVEENNINIDKSMTIVLDGERITVFPHSSYVVNDVEEIILLIKPAESIEDKFLEKMNLPSSEFFCEKEKEAIYLNNDIFECV